MTAPLVPSGSYFMIDGTYSCVMNSEVGTWRGTMLVRPEMVTRDEVLTPQNASGCVYEQTVITLQPVVLP